MPSPIVELGALVTCAHAGTAIPAPVSTRVLVDKKPAVMLTSTYVIAGCALTASSGPFCATGQFVVGATRVLTQGIPVAIATGLSTAIATANPMLVMLTQLRVLAT